MTWLIWRQYRVSAAISAALLAAFAALVVITGLHIASQFHAVVAACLAANDCRFPADNLSVGGGGPLGFLIEFTLAAPALLGMFLGAPLVAREIETGTGQFAWTQGVTRRRWLAAKVGWLLLAALVWGGAVGELVTWWSGPKNTAAANAFDPGTFDVQGIMPAAYSLFAMALGIAAGTLIRRVLPALAVTLFGYFGVRLVIMGWIRQHYITPVTATASIGKSAPLASGAFWSLAQGVRGPNGPIAMPNGSVPIVGNGLPVTDVPAACHTYLHNSGTPQSLNALFSCITSHGYTQYLTYQPASRYWPFQFIEAGIFVALTAALIAVAFALINRRDA